MRINTFILCTLIGWGSMTACSTHNIKEQLAEQSQDKDVIADKQRMKDELAATILNQNLVEKYIAMQKALENAAQTSNEELNNREWLEKKAIENGFDNLQHYESVSKKINMLVMYTASQDPKVKETFATAKEHIKKDLSKEDTDDSWVEGMLKDVVSNNIDSLIKAGEVVMEHTIKEINELVKDIPANEKALIKQNFDTLWSYNKGKMKVEL